MAGPREPSSPSSPAGPPQAARPDPELPVGGPRPGAEEATVSPGPPPCPAPPMNLPEGQPGALRLRRSSQLWGEVLVGNAAEQE